MGGAQRYPSYELFELVIIMEQIGEAGRTRGAVPRAAGIRNPSQLRTCRRAVRGSYVPYFTLWGDVRC